MPAVPTEREGCRHLGINTPNTEASIGCIHAYT